LPSFVTICLLGTAIAALLPACGSTDDPPNPPAHAGAGGGGAVGGGGSGGSDPVAKGAVVWDKQECASCHGADAKGFYGPNITYSMAAGIGGWTAAQFRAAVRDGKDTDGSDLCFQMTKFSAALINDAEMDDLFAYVKSKAVSDVVNQGTFCP